MKLKLLAVLSLVACATTPRGPDEVPGGTCSDEAKLVYVLDQNGTVSQFDPASRTFTDLGTLACPGIGPVFSMAVDRSAIAWVGDTNGAMWRVDLLGGLSCTATPWKGEAGMYNYGMAFSSDDAYGSTETLFIAGQDYVQPGAPSTLARLDTHAFTAQMRGTLPGAVELTGNAKAELWAFISSDRSGSTMPRLSRLDKATGNELAGFDLPDLKVPPLTWANPFWGGSVWIFLASTLDAYTVIYQVDAATGAIVSRTRPDGRRIVGAGVSTCAPAVLL